MLDFVGRTVFFGLPDEQVDDAMKVLRVLTRPNLGGPTRQAIALWHAHRAQGVETLLVTGSVGSEEVELLPSDHGVPVVTVAGDVGTGGWLQLPSLRRGLDPVGDRRAQASLRQLIRSYRPDVVHTHTSKAGWVGRRAAFAAARHRSTQFPSTQSLSTQRPAVAHTFHGHVLQDYFGRLPSLLLRRLERRLAARTDLLFAVSRSCAQELSDCGVADADRFTVLPPAVPSAADVLERSAARQRLGIAADQWRVAAVGRLVPIKRLADFVAMVSCSANLYGDVFGDGPERDRLARLADAPELAGRVLLRGAEPQIARLLPAYDAVVLSSVREGCPLVAIEAFAAAVPVVGYDVPGVRDALADYGRGVLVPESDGPAGLARALHGLRQDPETRSRLASAASAAVTLCQPEAVAARLSEEYAKAIASL